MVKKSCIVSCFSCRCSTQVCVGSERHPTGINWQCLTCPSWTMGLPCWCHLWISLCTHTYTTWMCRGTDALSLPIVDILRQFIWLGGLECGGWEIVLWDRESASFSGASLLMQIHLASPPYLFHSLCLPFPPAPWDCTSCCSVDT